jgi:hypothetical protein
MKKGVMKWGGSFMFPQGQNAVFEANKVRINIIVI